MAARRTVDPQGKERSIAMVSLRLTHEQIDLARDLARQRGCSRSELFRRLLMEALRDA